MKKIIALVLSLLMIISLAACGKSSNLTEQPSTEQDSAESSDMDDVADAETDETQEEAETQEETEMQKETETQEETKAKEESEIPDEQGSRILVAYFSATNTTKGVAEHIANGLGAELYEIVPEEPYTDADLDYNDDSSRSTIEMNDPDARPVISGSVENMDQYDIVFLGYPIWWGEAPRIISTFLESYDFSGKKVIPFCTSGSSGIGSSASNLHRLADRAEWLSGRRFGSSVSRNDMIEWVNSLGLGIQAQ